MVQWHQSMQWNTVSRRMSCSVQFHRTHPRYFKLCLRGTSLCMTGQYAQPHAAAGAPPILGQLYLPRDFYILSAEAGKVVREARSRARWRGEEAARPSHLLPASTRVQRVTCARPPYPVRNTPCSPASLVAHSNVDGLVAALCRPQRLRRITTLNSLENATWLFDWCHLGHWHEHAWIPFNIIH